MRILTPLIALALAACATTGSSDALTVTTVSRGQAVNGANCVVRTGAGSWNVVTPGTVHIGSANGDLHVICDKEGYRTSELVYGPMPVGASSVGLGLGGGGGHVGMGLGVNVPIGSSAGRYPGQVVIELNPQ